jgi:hypothetical protein
MERTRAAAEGVGISAFENIMMARRMAEGIARCLGTAAVL